MTSVATTPGQAIAGLGYTSAQVELIRNTIGKDLTNDELMLALAVAEHCGLDPFARQVYFLVYGKNGPNRKMQLVTGIDGYRAVASRSGAYAGSDDPVFDTDEGNPHECKVTVYRIVQGVRCPFTGVARLSEFRNPNNPDLWNKMPRNMLAKCAEAQALRKAFPAELAKVDFSADSAQIDPVTGEIIEGSFREAEARPQPQARVAAPAEPKPGASVAPSEDGLPIMCPDHETQWFKRGAMKTYGHPTGEKRIATKGANQGKEVDVWCQRPVVLGRMAKEARLAAEVSEEDGLAWCKETFGRAPSDLTEGELVQSFEHWRDVLLLQAVDEAGGSEELPFSDEPEDDSLGTLDGEQEPLPL